ncbi:hypothetical protein HID58_059983, partial [Brassica napus]
MRRMNQHERWRHEGVPVYRHSVRCRSSMTVQIRLTHFAREGWNEDEWE